jgi:hypothetical protein
MNLVEGVQSEIKRVTEIIQEYNKYEGGQFAAGLMQFDIDTAINLLATGDTVGLISIYQKLKEWEL